MKYNIISFFIPERGQLIVRMIEGNGAIETPFLSLPGLGAAAQYTAGLSHLALREEVVLV